MEKTNALRVLDKAQIHYHLYRYESDGEALDALSVANAIQQDPLKLYKTLIVRGLSKTHYVLIINAKDEIDLKKSAAYLHEKSIALIPVSDLLPLTGYVRGGCSPIGMKKSFTTVFDQTVLDQDSLIVSAGRIGLQMEIDRKTLVDFVKGKIGEISQKG
ncbi:MAG: Cys-tRNA(Pro) deacylase [Erysipelotrichaceae bacterium]